MTRTKHNGRRSSASKALNSAPSIAPKSDLNRGQTSGVGTQPREDSNQEHAYEDEAVQNQENKDVAMSEMMCVFRQFVQVCGQRLQDHLEEERVKDRKRNSFMLFLRCDPPKFHGEPDARKAEAWIEEVQKIFSVMHYDEEEKLEYAVFLLKGAAYNWWRIVEQRWNANNTPVTWMNFIEEFRDKFVPQVVRDSWEKEFMDLTQGSRSVFEYDAEFTRLVAYAPHIMNDERRMARYFIRGLQPEIQSAPALLGAGIEEYSQYREVVRIAMEVEETKKDIETRKRKAQAPLAGKPKVEARAYGFEG